MRMNHVERRGRMFHSRRSYFLTQILAQIQGFRLKLNIKVCFLCSYKREHRPRKTIIHICRVCKRRWKAIWLARPCRCRVLGILQVYSPWRKVWTTPGNSFPGSESPFLSQISISNTPLDDGPTSSTPLEIIPTIGLTV